MLISELKEEMRKRRMTIKQLASWSQYSAGFVGQVLNRTEEVEHLPRRVRRALEEIGILERTVELPTDRQLAYLRRLGFTGEVEDRSEAKEHSCENRLLRAIADRHLKRRDIARIYQDALRSGGEVNWEIIHRAIVERWSYFAVEWIRREAGRRSEAAAREEGE